MARSESRAAQSTDRQPWVIGDALGLALPADAQALREGGADWLTRAFRACGALASDNAVVRITECVECPGGSTGRKLLLAVEYAQPAPGLHRELFAKFSRDFDDPIRDQGRTQMELEVRFAALSRAPGFPIAVPACHYADYQAASGTGLLITQRIVFGRDGIEPHYAKCLDDEMPEAFAHYEALIKSLARLAGADQAQRLPAELVASFGFDPGRVAVGERAFYSERQLQNRVSRYAELAERHAVLLPPAIRSADFIARLLRDAVRFPRHEAAIRAHLQAQADAIALCHWNANVDNAWFWREPSGELACGLMDWGCASRMNVAMALWGCLSAADTALWDRHFDVLLDLFVDELHRSGGARLDRRRLEDQLLLYVALMGLNWLLDAPAYLRSLVPELQAITDRRDPRLRDNEAARSQLQMLTNVLYLWQGRDIGGVLDRFLAAH